MIKFTDTMLLASTKIRARKFRTAITILLAGLLFGVLVAASLVITGAFRSVESFREDGLTSRYIVNVFPNSGTDILVQLRRDESMIAEAKKRYENLVEDKIAEAERLGLPYTQASDQQPYTMSSDGEEELLVMHDSNGIVYDLFQEYFADKPIIDETKLEQVAESYSAKDTFNSNFYHILRGSTLETLPEGKEVFYDKSDDTERNANYIRPAISDMMSLTPPEITDPFLLPNNANWKPDGTSIPIILPQNAVEKLLGLDASTDKMTPAEKLAHLKNLRQKAMDLTAQACYRNDASNALIQQTVLQQREIEASQNTDGYQPPSMIYELPDPTKCENPLLISDTRTDEQKEQDKNQELFDDKFGDVTDPESYFVSFKVVGISPAQTDAFNPNQPEEQASSLNDIIDNLLQTSGVGQAIPQSLYNQLSDEAKKSYADILTFTPTYFMGNEDNIIRYVEFANVSDAQKFIDEQSCTTQVDGVCRPIERDYNLSLAFTNSAAIDDMQDKAKQWLGYAMVAVAVLAAIIMSITIGRSIADDRHETAVFRAIGFKRSDITSIYLLYTIMLSVFVAIFAAAAGYIGAYIINQQLSPALTVQAQYGFGGLDMTKEVSLIGFDQQQTLLILAVCLTTGLISVVIPLIGNMRRNPVRDMRKE